MIFHVCVFMKKKMYIQRKKEKSSFFFFIFNGHMTVSLYHSLPPPLSLHLDAKIYIPNFRYQHMGGGVPISTKPPHRHADLVLHPTPNALRPSVARKPLHAASLRFHAVSKPN